MRHTQLLATLLLVPLMAAAQQKTAEPATPADTPKIATPIIVFRPGKEDRFIRGAVAEFGPKPFFVGDTLLRPGRYALNILVQPSGAARLCFFAEATAQELGSPVPVNGLLASAPAQGKFLTAEEFKRQFIGGLGGGNYSTKNINNWNDTRDKQAYASQPVRRTQSRHPGTVGSTARSPQQWGTWGYGGYGKQDGGGGPDDDVAFTVPAMRVMQREKGFTVWFISWDGSMTADLPYAP